MKKDLIKPLKWDKEIAYIGGKRIQNIVARIIEINGRFYGKIFIGGKDVSDIVMSFDKCKLWIEKEYIKYISKYLK